MVEEKHKILFSFYPFSITKKKTKKKKKKKRLMQADIHNPDKCVSVISIGCQRFRQALARMEKHSKIQ